MNRVRRGGMTVAIAAALVLAALTTQGCGRAAPPAPSSPAPGGPATSPPSPSSSSPPPPSEPAGPKPLAPGWVEEPYNWDRQDGAAWCLDVDGVRFSTLIRCSPSGEWEVHPTHGGYARLCLVNRRLGLHKVWFSYTEQLSPSEVEGQMAYGLPWRPEPCFWAGDGSGVYLVYGERNRFFFVTVPEGTVARLNWDLHYKEIFGSPLGTRDLVVLEAIPDEADGNRIARYRLCVFTPEGHEVKCLHETDVYWKTQWAQTLATHQAFMLAVDAQPFDEPYGSKGWHTTFGEVRVYRPGPDGTWTTSIYENVKSPALRGDCLTLVEVRDGRPWVKQVSPSGAEEWLFPVPEVVARNYGDGQCRWDDRGQCLFFGEWQVLVRASE
ncbi:MAG: hypothetical protein K6U08_09735 [Firmicutes bacterium]|nr:hypothetical protein [Bacillota bacterium]